jgi:hypothetical protein
MSQQTREEGKSLKLNIGKSRSHVIKLDLVLIIVPKNRRISVRARNPPAMLTFIIAAPFSDKTRKIPFMMRETGRKCISISENPS